MSERSQKVIINNYESSAQDIRYEIPQGSILEPLHFLLYINDLPLYVEHGMSELYADDTTIHFSSNSIYDINIKLNEDMEKVQEWCTSNAMVIKTMKSQSMILGSSRKIQYLESDLNIFDDMFYWTM